MPDTPAVDIYLYKSQSIGKIYSGQCLYSNSECSYPTQVLRNSCGGYEIRFQNGAKPGYLVFQISPDWRDLCLTENTGCPEDMVFNRLGSLLNLFFLQRGACVFHGVVMDYQGSGILVMAQSGVGKSTHTNMWEEKEQAVIINGDRCLCRKIDGSWYSFGMPWIGSSQKLQNMATPIKHIVMLERDSHNHVEPLSGFEAELALLQRIFASVAIPELQDRPYELVHDIAENTNVVRLCCLPDYDSVQVLKSALFAEW